VAAERRISGGPAHGALLVLFAIAAPLAVLALIPATASARGAVLTVQVATTGGQVKGVSVVLRREGRGSIAGIRTMHLTQVARKRLKGRGLVFANLRPGRYAVTVTAPGAVGSFRFVKVAGRPVRVRLTLRRPLLDVARHASATFTPGSALTLTVHDARGITYQVVLPPNALAKPTTITLTPHKVPLNDRAAGDGFEIAPAGLRLLAQTTITVIGAPGQDLLAYDPARGAWLPQGASLDTLLAPPAERRAVAHQADFGFSPDELGTITGNLGGLFGEGIGTPDPATAAYIAGLASDAADLMQALAIAGEDIQRAGGDVEKAFGCKDPGCTDGNEAYQLWMAAANGWRNLARDAAQHSCVDTGGGLQSTMASLSVAINVIKAGALMSVAPGAGQTTDQFIAEMERLALRTCAERLQQWGNTACRTGEQQQVADYRVLGRKLYFALALQLANMPVGGAPAAPDLADQLQSKDIPGCTGYVVAASAPFYYNGSEAIATHTCDDLIAGHWTGAATITGADGSSDARRDDHRGRRQQRRAPDQLRRARRRRAVPLHARREHRHRRRRLRCRPLHGLVAQSAGDDVPQLLHRAPRRSLQPQPPRGARLGSHGSRHRRNAEGHLLSAPARLPRSTRLNAPDMRDPAPPASCSRPTSTRLWAAATPPAGGPHRVGGRRRLRRPGPHLADCSAT
jgi:hypothetical protein